MESFGYVDRIDKISQILDSMPTTTNKKISLFNFFIIIPPGLEQLGLEEFNQFLNNRNLKLDNIEVVKGGITVSLPLDVGFELNYFLKIPSSILLRIADFKCTDLPTLFKKIKNLNWRQYIQNGVINWTVTSRSSRVKIEKRIVQTCEEAYLEYSKVHAPRQNGSEHNIEVLIRVFQDRCTVSINTTGEMLFKRGYRSHINEAPLRENLASALILFSLYNLKKRLKDKFNSELPQELYLYDPMCGSGTIALEASTLHLPNRIRSFDFENFKICPDHLRPHHQKYWKKNFSLLPPNFNYVYGTDKNLKSIQACELNYQDLKRKIDKSFNVVEAQFQVLDLFESKKINIKGKNTIFLFNPPYGIRIKTEKDMLNKAVAEIAKSYQPLLIGFVCPTDLLTELRVPQGYSKPFTLATTGGGIRLSYWVTISTTEFLTLD